MQLTWFNVILNEREGSELISEATDPSLRSRMTHHLGYRDE